LVAGDQRVSYAELDRRADRLAARLRRRGVGPDVPVGVHLERSIDVVVAFLGILKAGGAYVPLDPGYPAERLRFMLSEAGATIAVTNSALRESLGQPGLDVLVVDEPEAGDDLAAAKGDGAGPDSLAWPCRTAGSSGSSSARPTPASTRHARR
jgi:non-ribosomal peptide synthetase component F